MRGCNLRAFYQKYSPPDAAPLPVSVSRRGIPFVVPQWECGDATFARKTASYFGFQRTAAFGLIRGVVGLSHPPPGHHPTFHNSNKRRSLESLGGATSECVCASACSLLHGVPAQASFSYHLAGSRRATPWFTYAVSTQVTPSSAEGRRQHVRRSRSAHDEGSG